MKYNFIETYKVDKVLCDNLIKYHKKNKEYKTIGIVGGGKIDKKNQKILQIVSFTITLLTHI